MIGKIDGDYQFDSRKTTLIWTLPVIDQSNSEGSLEFTMRGKAGDFFPVQVDFNSETSFCDIKVRRILFPLILPTIDLFQIAGVKSVEKRQPVAFSHETSLIVDKYEYV